MATGTTKIVNISDDLDFSNLNQAIEIKDEDLLVLNQDGEKKAVKGTVVKNNIADYWYGFHMTNGQIASVVTAIGRADLQLSKPCTAAIYPAMIAEDSSEVYKLDTLDIRKKLDQTPSDLTGPDGDAMSVIPEYYLKFEITGNDIDFKFSPFPIPGFTRIPKHAKGLWKAYKDPATAKLRSISGVIPSVNMTRAAFRIAAQAKTAHPGWCIDPYFIKEADFFLWVAESLNLNSQEAIGAGATNANSADWNNYNGYNPVWDNGTGNDALIRTGQIAVSVADFVNTTISTEPFTSVFDNAVALLHNPIVSGSVVIGAYVEGTDYAVDYTAGTITVYSTGSMSDATQYAIDYHYLAPLGTNIAVQWWMRDIFGHIWDHVDGININNDPVAGSRAFICKNIADFANNTQLNYELAGQLAELDGYISQFVPGTILPIKGMPTGSSSQNVGDYYYTYFDNDPASGWRVALWSGALGAGAFAGLCCAAFNSADTASSSVGSRLCLVY